MINMLPKKQKKSKLFLFSTVFVRNIKSQKKSPKMIYLLVFALNHSGEKFERISKDGLIFEPMMFLRDKKLHNSYC